MKINHATFFENQDQADDQKDQARLRSLLEKASPLPWRGCVADGDGCTCHLVWSVTADQPVACTDDPLGADDRGEPRRRADATLIVAAVNALTGLLNKLEACEDANAYLHKEMHSLRSQAGQVHDIKSRNGQLKQRSAIAEAGWADVVSERDALRGRVAELEACVGRLQGQQLICTAALKTALGCIGRDHGFDCPGWNRAEYGSVPLPGIDSTSPCNCGVDSVRNTVSAALAEVRL